MSITDFCLVCAAEQEHRLREGLETFQIRGEPIELMVQRHICTRCGSILTDEANSDAIIRAAYDEYRRRHGLLIPEEIRRIREQYGLSQEAFAALLGMSEATVNRYEKGSVQEETHDNLMRLAARPDGIAYLFSLRRSRLSPHQQAKLESALSAQAPGKTTEAA